MARKGRASASAIAALALATAAVMLACGLLSMKGSASPSPSGQAVTASSETACDALGFPEVDWEYWRSVNPDVIGWITVPGTEVDQPIVQASSDDPEYYLHHDVYRKTNVYGVPYLDASCSATGLLGSPNAVVFGHHMSDGSVFAALSQYSTSVEFAEEHPVVLLQTPSEKRVLSVRFARIVDGSSSSKRTTFLDDTDRRQWYAAELAGASTVLDADATPPSSLVCLCTCSYNIFDNERTLVYAS